MALTCDSIASILSGDNPQPSSRYEVVLRAENSNLSDLGSLHEFQLLEELHLAHNNLTNSALSLCLLLPSLRKIDVSHNKLATLLPWLSEEAVTHIKSINPDGVTDLFVDDQGFSCLQELDASFNQISKISSLRQHKYLKVLKVSNNQISHFRELSRVPSLQYLDASHNRAFYPSSLPSLPVLSSLFLANNLITSATKLAAFPALRVLSLANNSLVSCDGLQKYSKLVELDLANNKIRSLEEVKKLRELRFLSELTLTNNPLTSDPKYRSDIIYWLPQLTVLDGIPVSAKEKFQSQFSKDTYKTDFDAVRQRYLPDGLKTTKDSFQSQAAKNDALLSDKTALAEAEQILSEDAYWLKMAERGFLVEWEPFLARVNELKPQSIDLSKIDLGDVGFWALSCAVSENGTIRHLCLDACVNPIRWSRTVSSQYGLREFLQSISGASSPVTYLSLAGCHLGPDDAEAIASLLTSGVQLEYLNLSNNRLGANKFATVPSPHSPEAHPTQLSPGLITLCQAILACPSLKTVDLADNEIDTQGIRVIARMLAGRPLVPYAAATEEVSALVECKLQQLCLEDNLFDKEGGIALAEALQTNSALKRLLVRIRANKSVSDAEAAAWANTLRLYNRSLVHLDFAEDVPLTSDAEAHFSSIIQRLAASATVDATAEASPSVIDQDPFIPASTGGVSPDCCGFTPVGKREPRCEDRAGREQRRQKAGVLRGVLIKQGDDEANAVSARLCVNRLG